MAEEFSTEMLFGELDDKGHLKRDVRHTAIPEGMRVEAGDAQVGVEGTNYFYYIKAPIFRSVTIEDRQKVEARVKGTMTTSVVQPTASPAPASRAFSKTSKVEDKDVTNDSSN